MNKSLRTAKKSMKRAGRKLSAGVLTVAATGAAIPYRFRKELNEATGDNGYVITSLLFETRISPKCEDSVANKTLISVSLRPMKEVREDLERFEALCTPKKPVIVEEPAPLPEEEDEKLKKATKKVKKLEKKITKRRAKLAKQRAKKAARA